MNLCRFKNKQGEQRWGLVEADSTIIDLTGAGLDRVHTLLENLDPQAEVERLTKRRSDRIPLSQVQLCAPIEHQEVWAAGVTYLRSKSARMEESDFSATAYDRVYSAARPELFFKSLPEKVVGPGGDVGIRRDANWSVPEPELALVINSMGRIAGVTIGNDMSSRDIEGENLLYLPQAKVYRGSCALGPWIHIGSNEETIRNWIISISIERAGVSVFKGETSVGRIKRSFQELADYLFRSQEFPNGAILLTGTGVVPPDNFTLEAGDVVTIAVSGIGTLKNTVMVV
jgi:2-dehydro-3-deoxy-D-arabinonate dehydratase